MPKMLSCAARTPVGAAREGRDQNLALRENSGAAGM